MSPQDPLKTNLSSLIMGVSRRSYPGMLTTFRGSHGRTEYRHFLVDRNNREIPLSSDDVFNCGGIDMLVIKRRPSSKWQMASSQCVVMKLSMSDAMEEFIKQFMLSFHDFSWAENLGGEGLLRIHNSGAYGFEYQRNRIHKKTELTCSGNLLLNSEIVVENLRPRSTGYQRVISTPTADPWSKAMNPWPEDPF